MQKSSPNPAQGNFLFPNLIDQLDPRHPLLKLAQHIPWQFLKMSLHRTILTGVNQLNLSG